MITEMSDLAYDAFGETYRGEILHHGTAYPGQHKSIIDPEFWQIVQDKLAANRRRNCCFFPLPEPSGDIRPRMVPRLRGNAESSEGLAFLCPEDCCICRRRHLLRMQ